MRYRRERVQDLLREEISSIIFQDLRDQQLGLITILEVRVTPDLKHAKVMYSVYGDNEAHEKAEKTLKKSKGYMKFLLGQRVKLRYIPDLHFVPDDRHEVMARIEAILKKDEHGSGDSGDH
jgi:ribosome-binding factor A